MSRQQTTTNAQTTTIVYISVELASREGLGASEIRALLASSLTYKVALVQFGPECKGAGQQQQQDTAAACAVMLALQTADFAMACVEAAPSRSLSDVDHADQLPPVGKTSSSSSSAKVISSSRSSARHDMHSSIRSTMSLVGRSPYTAGSILSVQLQF